MCLESYVVIYIMTQIWFGKYIYYFVQVKNCVVCLGDFQPKIISIENTKSKSE